MDKRSKDFIRGRKSVLNADHSSDLKRTPGYSPKTRNRSLKRAVPLFVLGFIVLLIARQEIPAVNDAWERTITPDKWLAKKTCQNAALESIKRKAFARILRSGKVNKTTDGLYIENVVIGEMSVSGIEVSVEYSCYLTSAGDLIKLNRIENSNK